MKKKLKRTLAAISAAAMMFTTAAIMPEKIPDFIGITASAEETAQLPDENAVASVSINSETTYVSDLDAALGNEEYAGATITLLKDISREEVFNIKINCTLDLNDHTVYTTGVYQSCIGTYGNTNVTIQGEGKVISENGHGLNIGGIVTLNGGTFISGGEQYCGVYVNSESAALYVTSEKVNIIGDYYGLCINAVDCVQLSAGTISSNAGNAITIWRYGQNPPTLGDILGHKENTRYAFYDGDEPIVGKLGDLSLEANTVTVKECDHSAAIGTDNGDGTHKISCPACGKDEKEAAEAHKGGTATCQEKAKCAICGAEYGELGAHTIVNIPASDATCVKTGNIKYWACSDCGACFSDEEGENEITLADTVIKTTGHTLTHIEQKDSTCTDNGNIEYWYCSECNKYFSDENCTTEITLSDTLITANGHNYVDGKCSECGVYENGIGEHLEGYSLSLNGNIGVNFYMGLDENVIADENAYMQFILPNGETLKVKVSNAEQQKMNGNTYYVFSCEVAAKEMFDKITAQIITSDKMGEVYTYSVEEYIQYIRENSSEFDEKTINLVNAMASYGNYAMAYFNKEELFAMPEMDSITADTLAGFEKQTSGELPEGITYYGSSLLLESNTTIRHYFKAADGTDVSAYGFDGSADSYYYKEISGIPAGKLSTAQNITVDNYTISYNPMSYAYAVLNSDSTSESLKNLVKALYLYEQAAEAYQK